MKSNMKHVLLWTQFLPQDKDIIAICYSSEQLMHDKFYQQQHLHLWLIVFWFRNYLLMNKDNPYPKGAWVQISPALYASCADPLINPPPTQVAPMVNIPTNSPMSRPANITWHGVILCQLWKITVSSLSVLFTKSLMTTYFLIGEKPIRR